MDVCVVSSLFVDTQRCPLSILLDGASLYNDVQHMVPFAFNEQSFYKLIVEELWFETNHKK